MDNKYLAVYNSLNIAIDASLTIEEAALVAQHVALIHNALGFAIRDLIKIVSFKYPQPDSELPSPPEAVSPAFLEKQF